MNFNLLLLAVVLGGASMPTRAADGAVSATPGQPGFYGRIDVAGYPRPRLLFAQPRMLSHGPSVRPPIYLYVPPEHARNWHRHCSAYNACDERSFFVRESWYSNQYVPRYQERNRQSRADRPLDGQRDRHRAYIRTELRGSGSDRGEQRRAP